MRKLFVSFTATLTRMQEGKVSEVDLDNGLFAFGCTRDHALAPGAAGGYVEEVVKERPDLHERLVAAVLAAEHDGRVAWRDKGLYANMEYAKINVLLCRNGFDPIVENKLRPHEGDYCYPGVEERVLLAGLDLKVVR